MTTEDFCTRLVDLVFDNPLLYNPTHLQHKNSARRLEVWDGIGKELGASGDDCAKRWRYLRDRYRVKHKKMNEPGANLVQILSSFPYYDKMRFLDDFKTEHKNTTNQWAPQSTSKDNSYECEVDEQAACLVAGSNNDELVRIISAQLGEQLNDPKLSPSTSRSDDYEPKPKYYRAEPDEAVEKMLDKSVELLRESNDVLRHLKPQFDDRQTVFMHYVMMRLREMSPSQQKRIEDGIIDLIREIQ